MDNENYYNFFIYLCKVSNVPELLCFGIYSLSESENTHYDELNMYVNIKGSAR